MSYRKPLSVFFRKMGRLAEDTKRRSILQTAASSLFFFSSRRRHTRLQGDWSSDVCSSDLGEQGAREEDPAAQRGDDPHRSVKSSSATPLSGTTTGRASEETPSFHAITL